MWRLLENQNVYYELTNKECQIEAEEGGEWALLFI